MPFELIVQSAFTERLEGGRVRVRAAGEHISDPEHVAALDGHSHVVRVWTDEPAAAAKVDVPAAGESDAERAPAPSKPTPAPVPASAPAKP